jgi:hypothetical protein
LSLGRGWRREGGGEEPIYIPPDIRNNLCPNQVSWLKGLIGIRNNGRRVMVSARGMRMGGGGAYKWLTVIDSFSKSIIVK